MKEIKVIIVILFCLLLYSCASKSIYYAWEVDGENWNYCTLEVKKHEVIFRGSSTYLMGCGWVHYLYLYSYDPYKYSSNFKEDVIPIYINNFESKYFIIQEPLLYDPGKRFEYKFGSFSTANEWSNFSRGIFYVMGDNNSDTLYLSNNVLIKEDYTLNGHNCNVQDSTLLSKGVNWFPPKMHRVSKIEYERFDKDLQQQINLKEPWKGTHLNGQHPRESIWY